MQDTAMEILGKKKKIREKGWISDDTLGTLRLRYYRKTYFNCCRSTYKCVVHEDFTLRRCGKL